GTGRGDLMQRPRLRYGGLAAVLAASVLITGQPAAASPQSQAPLTAQQRAVLLGVARDTWSFFAQDVDPATHLPLDNLGPGTTRAAYTSPANIGGYLWSVVSAGDLQLITRDEERRLAVATLTSVSHLKRSHGFLYQWYDTSTGAVIRNP